MIFFIFNAVNLNLYDFKFYQLLPNFKQKLQPAITCLKLTIKTPERRQWSRSGVFTVNCEHITHLVLVFPLLTVSNWMSAGTWLLSAKWSWLKILSKYSSLQIFHDPASLSHWCYNYMLAFTTSFLSYFRKVTTKFIKLINFSLKDFFFLLGKCFKAFSGINHQWIVSKFHY